MRLVVAVLAAALSAAPAHAAFTHSVQSPANVARAAAVFKPKLVGAPTITGTPRERQVLTAADGTWDRQPTSVTRVWLRCDAAGENCVEIPSATGTTYKLVAADASVRLRLRVTAQNAGGATSALSVPTAVIERGIPINAPQNVSLPAITGLSRVDELLTAEPGVWAGEEITYSYQWMRCASASSCVELTGETRERYRLESADVDTQIRVSVTATNDAAARSRTSSPTASVARPTYTYVACANPDTGKGVWGPGMPPGFVRATDPEFTVSTTTRCDVGASAPAIETNVTGGGTSTPWTHTRLKYVAPSGVELVGGDLYRVVILGNYMGYAFTVGPDGPIYPGAWAENSYNHGSTGAGTPGERFVPNNRQGISSQTLAGFGFSLHCHTNGAWCSPNGLQAIYGGKLKLRDMAAPTISSAATGTLAGGTLGITATLGLDVRDAQSGLYRVRVFLDDVQVAARVLASSGTPRCGDVNPGNGDEYEFASHTPCPSAFTSTLSFDTTTWPKGTRQLHVLVEDAGHNTVTVVKRAVSLG
jgi:hypothetical protein